MIKYLENNKKEFLKYLDNLISKQNAFDDDYYDFEGFDYEYIKEKITENKEHNIILFTDEKGDINNFAFFEKEDDLIIFTIDDISSPEIRKNLEDLKENFSHPIISCSPYFCDITDLNVYEMNLKSNIIDEDYIYHDLFFCLNKEDTNVLVTKCDDFNFSKYTGNLSFEIADYNDFVSNLMRSDKIISTSTKNDLNQNHIAGFYYFGQYDPKGDNVLLAKDNGNVVGCIKYGIYGTDCNFPHISLCFVDVKIPYRNKGIATRLFKEFGKILEKQNLPLYLTDESELGETCHMKDIALREIKNTDIFLTDKKDYVYVSYRNNEEINHGRNYKELFPEYFVNKEEDLER